MSPKESLDQKKTKSIASDAGQAVEAIVQAISPVHLQNYGHIE